MDDEATAQFYARDFAWAASNETRAEAMEWLMVFAPDPTRRTELIEAALQEKFDQQRQKEPAVWG